MRLIAEAEGEARGAAIPNGGATLVAFLSFAAARGFGARHPLIALAELAARRGVPLGPLTTFYERRPEDAEDEANLERAWQEAGPLAASLAALRALLAEEADAGALLWRGGAGTLAQEAAALEAFAEAAGRAGRRVRLTYEL